MNKNLTHFGFQSKCLHGDKVFLSFFLSFFLFLSLSLRISPHSLCHFISFGDHFRQTQIERHEVMKEYKKGDFRILVTTDVGMYTMTYSPGLIRVSLVSRGMDVRSIRTVINFDLAKNIGNISVPLISLSLCFCVRVCVSLFLLSFSPSLQSRMSIASAAQAERVTR